MGTEKVLCRKRQGLLSAALQQQGQLICSRCLSCFYLRPSTRLSALILAVYVLSLLVSMIKNPEVLQ